MADGGRAKTPHLILGGARSGKSCYAEKLIVLYPAPYTYVATAEIRDEEMRERVMLHRQRREAFWETVECPVDLPAALTGLQGKDKPVLVDCITIWLSNLLCGASADPEGALDALCSCIGNVDYPLFVVSNEVGGGIVPENPLARRFRDLAGFANQKIAVVCKAVTLVVAGLPLALK